MGRGNRSVPTVPLWRRVRGPWPSIWAGGTTGCASFCPPQSGSTCTDSSLAMRVSVPLAIQRPVWAGAATRVPLENASAQKGALSGERSRPAVQIDPAQQRRAGLPAEQRSKEGLEQRLSAARPHQRLAELPPGGRRETLPLAERSGPLTTRYQPPIPD